MPQATRLAAAISKAVGLEAELVRGERGVFDVDVNGRRVFSKHSAHRFPDAAEIIDAVTHARDG